MGLGISLLITLPALDGITLFGTELSVLGPTAAGTAGLVGASIIDRILEDDEDEEGGGGDDGEGMMDEFGGEMDDEFGGGMDDEFGGGGMDDEFGGGGMEGDFGGGGGGGNIDELEHQIDELENEVASLSSTVNTVKSENEEISGRIEDVEEDVRNLLDIYEMVTRGINPFVDEQDAGDFDVGDGGGLGLFDDGEEDDSDVDDSVMEDDADDFFDEDIIDDEEDDEFDEMDEADDEFDELDEADDEFDEMDDEFEELDVEDDDTDSEEMVSEQDSTGGKSFSELKDEYDSGDASWAEDGEDDSFEDDSMDDDLGMDDSFEDDSMDDSFEDDSMDDDLGMDDSFEDDSTDDLGMDDSGESFDGEPTAETEPETAPVDDTEGDFEYVTSDQLSSSGDKPYLTSIPGDYVGDLVVMEWLEYLVEESTVTDAARAVNYYERIDWIDEAAADHLRSFLSGFGEIDRNKVSQPGTDQLTRTHHVHSLKYIMKLNNGTTATSVILDRWDSFAQGNNGL